ncbi:MAG: sigma-70 family RNA polymerase sigma factor [Opitutales bacterium]|nr:sigma-70 family RNA polymerase sigma factor [Opitutales bacterium]
MDETNPYKDDPDVNCMLRLQAGDLKAFDEIVLRWQNPLINYFHRSIQPREQAEDLAQMVFIRVYKAASGYEPRAKFSTYLFQIARHHLINHYRHQSRRPLDIQDPADIQAVSPEDSTIALNDLEAIFEKTLEHLPENQRTAILLLKQQELSYQEIAEIMDASEGAVKTWIFRARQFLKQALKDFV